MMLTLSEQFDDFIHLHRPAEEKYLYLTEWLRLLGKHVFGRHGKGTPGQFNYCEMVKFHSVLINTFAKLRHVF